MSRTFANRTSAKVVDGFFSSLSAMGRALPQASPERHGVERIENLSYGPHGDANLLDIWRPTERASSLPVVLYIHGGGFRSLSKDSHWIMALVMARRGYLVVNINYRLTPAGAYPGAIEDTCAALIWTLDHAADFGGDLSRLVYAGESAGANLTLAPGSFNVLLGHTLAGKTTLMRLMAGLDAPDSGRVFLDGRDLTGVPVRKRNVSMVYQQFINYPTLTVFDNIASPLKLAKVPTQEIAALANDTATHSLGARPRPIR